MPGAARLAGASAKAAWLAGLSARTALGVFCAAAFVLSAGPLAALGAEVTGISGEAILGQVKAKFRAYQRPAFVGYTLSRQDGIVGRPGLADAYTLRVWCRTADRAALARSVRGAVADGPLTFVRPAFNQAVDPGPPTADIFERNAFAPAAAAAAAETPPAEIPTLAVVAVHVETDYRVERVESIGTSYVLQLAPRRDPARNRLRTLWVDRDSFDLERAIATDTLYAGDAQSAEVFDMRFEKQDGIPVIRTIEMRSDTAKPLELGHRGVFRFQNIAFATAMPGWYFEPTMYEQNARSAPR